jgi:hypothetical protein
MPRGKAKQDTETLEMALVGFEQKKVEIDEKIRHIKSLLSGSPVSSPKKARGRKPRAAAVEVEVPTRKKRTLSASARKRIAAAQKKRWAEHRKNQPSAAE